MTNQSQRRLHGMSETSNEVYYDHLSDGTILDPMPFHDGRKMAALLQERMTPDVLGIVTEILRLDAIAQQGKN
ncbi:hypothetical protein [Streptomyces sp. SID4982]|uniref:hypothetical protein n=1 Tax=Streptomyces sp. SID4982 TaxID=2690291 RepID=UPI00137157AC|nr:hypothetical protein [Streptomyces sp. SID4982]MYS15039.1 hypothetical protein [Streptomyces sp. SID4982]